MRQQEFIGQYLIGYHGTDQSVVDRVLSGKAKHLEAGGLGHDWLGDGIYFWVDSPERAFAWANERSRFPGSSITAPAAIGAVIQPGRCFNLTDFGAAQQLKGAYDHLKSAIEAAKKPMPVNTVRDKYGLYRKRALDCLVSLSQRGAPVSQRMGVDRSRLRRHGMVAISAVHVVVGRGADHEFRRRIAGGRRAAGGCERLALSPVRFHGLD